MIEKYRIFLEKLLFKFYLTYDWLETHNDKNHKNHNSKNNNNQEFFAKIVLMSAKKSKYTWGKNNIIVRLAQGSWRGEKKPP